MARHTPELFRHRRATQDFLFSPSDDIVDQAKKEELPDLKTDDNVHLKIRFPEMLDRKGLEEAIACPMASASSLCILAIKVEGDGRSEADRIRQTDISQTQVEPIAHLCLTHGGSWGRIGRNRFAGLFTGRGASDAYQLGQDLLKAVADQPNCRMTIGAAAYPTIHYTRGQTLINAEKALDHAGFIGPGTVTLFDAVSLNISGDHYYQAGNISSAIQEFEMGLRLDPADANLHNSLGVCYGIIKEYDKALAAFDTAGWLDPADVMAVYNKGYMLLLKGLREEALTCFLEANALEADVFEVVFHIGQLFMEMGSVEKARPYLEAATRANSRSGSAFKSLGACLDQQGLTREAIQAYKRTVKINPADAQSLSNLGRLYTQRGESLDVASVFCEQSVRIAPNDGLFRHRLGRVYLDQGKLDQALAAFELAEALGHDSRRQIEETQDRLAAAEAS